VILLIGYLAAVVDVGQFAPQLWRAIRRRNDHVAIGGLSVLAYTIATVQATLWVIYGFATDRLPIGLPNLFIAPACGYILVLTLRSKRRGTGGGLTTPPQRDADDR
jgi:uncharacterized protein with PQ loop repeat